MNRLVPIALFLSFCSVKLLAQDTIMFEKTWPYIAEVQEVKADQIIFRKVRNGDTLNFTIDKRFVSEIRYQNPELGRQEITLAPISLVNNLDVWIIPSDSIGMIEASVQSLNDSTLYLKKRKKFLERTDGLTADIVYVFPHQRIHTIKVRQRNKIRRYATYGAIGGFALGTITGLFIYNDDPVCVSLNPDGLPCDASLASPRTRLDKALVLGFGSGAAGFLAGGITGSIRITIPIGGRRDAFEQSIPRLLRLAKNK